MGASGSGKEVSAREKAQYIQKRKLGLSPEQAAKTINRSKGWAYQFEKGLDASELVWTAEGDDMPSPKSYDELDGGVRDLLKNFNLFREVILCRDQVPWAEEAADRTVAMLLNKQSRDFSVMNEPPGSGKTTLFTHDLVAWLICGGGFEDPAVGRALRIMLGSEAQKTAINYVRRLRNLLQNPRPFYDKNTQRRAELSIIDAFGRFRPRASLGEDAMWTQKQFIVAQIGDLDVYEKEPTVQAASRQSGFLGERVVLAVWDDLVTNKNCRNPDLASDLAQWFQDEAETRVEPGGLLALVGQRLSNLDLYRNRLDAQELTEDGTYKPKYHHIVFPAHDERRCPGGGSLGPACRQRTNNDGCLLDAYRLGWRDLLKVITQGNYRTVFLQEDSNPEDILVQDAWITGGRDADGFDAPGCWDHERGAWEWPDRQTTLTVTYATVDPSVENFWATEIWARDLNSNRRYLIYGERRRMRAGTERGFLDFDPDKQLHVGLMEELQLKSAELGNPIQIWFIESNAAHRYLLGTIPFKLWRQKWSMVDVVPHVTGQNKVDEDYGVDAVMGMVYKLGLKRLPGAATGRMKQYLDVKINELTKYPQYATDDTVMSDWFGEYNQRLVERKVAKIKRWQDRENVDPNMPPYLAKRAKYHQRGIG